MAPMKWMDFTQNAPQNSGDFNISYLVEYEKDWAELFLYGNYNSVSALKLTEYKGLRIEMDDNYGSKLQVKVYGDATGVLTGDALQAFAFEVIAKADMGPEMMRNQLEMMKVLAVGCGYQGMCGGQELDMEAENREVTREELEKVHKYKTGALIESSVELGLLCRKNMPEAEKEAFRAYSRAIGLAFQVWDDVLDIISNTDILGKPQGSDVESNKSTYPKLMGLDGAKEYAKSLALTAVNALKPLPYDTALLQDFAMFIVERDH